MLHTSLPRWSLLLLGLLSSVAGAFEGDCRSRLKPLLLQGAPDARELAQSKALCQAEAAAGGADATYQLSFFPLGLGGEWAPAEALPLMQSAADRGISEAQYWLAWQSESGPLLSHDPEVALNWYQKAAASQHRLALGRLADAWERGELGLPVEPRKALELRAQIRRCEEKTALLKP